MESKSINTISLKIAKEYIGEDVLEVKQIAGKGEVNDTYIFTTESNKRIVRIDPNETTLDRFRKEAWCMNEAMKHSVPGPQVIKIGMKNGHPYMVMSYIKGVDGEDVGKEQQTKIWQTLGEYARKVHSIKVSGHGEKMTSDGIFDGSWGGGYLEYNIASLNDDDKLLELGIITPEQSKMLRDIFLRLKHTPLTFGLIHNDFSLSNARMSQDGTIYLLDWGSAGVNVIPHIDIIEILQSSLEENSKEFGLFLEHYGINREEYEAMKPDIANLKLLLRTDKLRWAIDKRPELIKKKTREFKNAFGQ